MPLGILRNRYQDLLKTKGKKKQTKKRFSKASLTKTFDDQEYIKSNLLSNSTRASQVEMTEIDQPMWIDDYQDCCFILKEVEICRQQIKKQQAKKLTAIRQQIHEKRILLLSQQATSKLHTCQKKLKSIQLSNLQSTPHQQKIFTNIIISLAQKIRSLTKVLRNDQQHQLNSQKEFQRLTKTKFQEDYQQIQKLKYGFQEEWLGQEGLEQMEQQINTQRNQEIMRIVKSIHSLNTIYKELQSLVIHQGSLLDRIDLNIQNTHQNVVKANEQLKQAQQHQKSPLAKKVIVILIVLIVICLVIFIARHR